MFETLFSVKVEKNESSDLIDITPYLWLPQKIVAAKLGVTESYLCRKFKEASNRKWPHRYLIKLERELNQTHSKEEKEILIKQKNDLLAPLILQIKTTK